MCFQAQNVLYKHTHRIDESRPLSYPAETASAANHVCLSLDALDWSYADWLQDTRIQDFSVKP